MKPASEEAAVGAVSVYWEIKKCPVPDGYDARRVGARIKRYIRKLGYTGAISITAVGVLSKVPEKMLEEVSSTGIILCTGPYGHKDMVGCIIKHSPGDNIMVISRSAEYSVLLGDIIRCDCGNSHCDWDTSDLGFNVIYPYPEDRVSTDDAKKLWEDFIMEDPEEEDDDDKCCETEAIWVCRVCRLDQPNCGGLGFASFMAHLYSAEHERIFPEWFPEVVEANKATSMDSEDDSMTTGDEDDVKTSGDEDLK